MATVTLTPSDLQRLKADPRFSAAHAALLEIMIAQGEVIIEPATVPHTSQALEP